MHCIVSPKSKVHVVRREYLKKHQVNDSIFKINNWGTVVLGSTINYD